MSEPPSPFRGALSVALQTATPAVVSSVTALAADDGLWVIVDPTTDEMRMFGATESALEQAIDRLSARFGDALRIGPVEVVYLETIARRTEIDYTYRIQFGASGQFAGVKLVVEPVDPASGVAFEARLERGALPEATIAIAFAHYAPVPPPEDSPFRPAMAMRA